MFLCEWKKNIFKKEPSKIDLRGSRTHNLVITRSLLYHLHHNFLLLCNIFLYYIKSCPFWFVDSPFCCKCSYDIQQEDICIKPRSIGLQVWKVLLVKIRLMKQNSQNSKMIDGKEPWTFGYLAFCSNTSAIETYQLWDARWRGDGLDSLWRRSRERRS